MNITLFSVLCMALVACDSNQVKHKKTLEEQLVDSFRLSEKTIRDRVQVVVQASEDKNYTLAMNELGILSATQITDQPQKHAIKQLMEQLRFNLEEEDLARKTSTASAAENIPGS